MVAGGEFIPWKEAIENAQPLIARALELDENSSEAHVANGNLAMQYHLDFELAEREFRRVIELDASSSAATQTQAQEGTSISPFIILYSTIFPAIGVFLMVLVVSILTQRVWC